MGVRSRWSVLMVVVVLGACDPWWAGSLQLDGRMILIDDPSTPEQGCNDGSVLTMTVNDEVLPPVEAAHEDCIQGFCVCVPPFWVLDPALLPDRDDGLMTLTLSDGETTREMRTEDPWIPPPVLVGDPVVRRGVERRIDWYSETPPSADDWWDFRIGRVCLTDPCEEDPLYSAPLYSRCPDTFYGCEGSQDVDDANVRFEGNAMFFTLPEEILTGALELRPGRTFVPEHLECGFGHCEVALTDGVALPITVE